jgi:putative membrane protein
VSSKNTVKLILLALGLAVAVALYASQDFATMLQAIRKVGWLFIVVAAFHLLPLFFNTLGWWILMARPRPVGLGSMFTYRWIGESVNTLLPVAHVGGDLLRARLLARHMPGSTAGAVTMVDFTMGIVAQLIFTLTGVLLLINTYSSKQIQHSGEWLLLGLGLVLIPIVLFYVLQRFGLFGHGLRVLRRLMSSARGQDWANKIETLDEKIRLHYRDYGGQARCVILRLVAWVLGVGETWLGLQFMGVSINLSDALVLESLGYAARSLGFLIPGGLGIVEGALFVVGGELGIAGPHALALALIKRGRELVLGSAGLGLWYRQEHRYRGASTSD